MEPSVLKRNLLHSVLQQLELEQLCKLNTAVVFELSVRPVRSLIRPQEAAIFCGCHPHHGTHDGTMCERGIGTLSCYSCTSTVCCVLPLEQ